MSSQAMMIVCTPSEGATGSMACGEGYVASLVQYVPDHVPYELIGLGFSLALIAYTIGLVLSPVLMLTRAVERM